jgi:DNA modification methylase
MKVINQKSGANWMLYHGDCCEVVKAMPENSIHFSIFSPPFASLYTYSNSERDMGNCKDDGAFMEHFGFLVKDLFRVTKPGRLLSFHCMNLPTSKQFHGVIGLRDFRGELIRLFESHGWIFHSEVVIWKDPVTAMQRTKALGLLHKQVVKDSCMSRQGVPDYLVTMRKPGVNTERVEGQLDHYSGDEEKMLARVETIESLDESDKRRFSIDVWQRYASPVWMDINPSLTLQNKSARDNKDERHICPLQLQVIDRALELWSNPGDTVLSPFAGIGSEGYEAVKMGRKFVGVELKESYFKQAYLNLEAAEKTQSELIPLKVGIA